jgi:ATP-dependent exoDNAse (exonuclease V) beta subunit
VGALAERDAWIASDMAMRETAREELRVFPATRDEGDIALSALMLAADDEPLIASNGPPAAVGEAMHRILELVDLRHPLDVEATVESICSLAGLAELADEVTELVLACLDSPVLERLRACGRSWTEVPYTLRIAAGYATGRIDLVFEEGAELVVVDWKSDSVGPEDVGAAAESHRPQAIAYATALEAATGVRPTQVVFVFPRARSEAELTV